MEFGKGFLTGLLRYNTVPVEKIKIISRATTNNDLKDL